MDLAVSGISTTGAIVSWTSGAEAIDWEYQLVISGETPAEAGTSTSDNPFTVTGCYANTSYDFYVRTNCGGTMSSWASLALQLYVMPFQIYLFMKLSIQIQAQRIAGLF